MTARVQEAWDLYEQGLRPHEIAKRLGKSISTVNYRINRAKLKLGVYERSMDREGADIPRCKCRLALFGARQIAQGHCDSCTPTAASFAGRQQFELTYPGGPCGR